jgi:SAM-dependent methyltransferase
VADFGGEQGQEHDRFEWVSFAEARRRCQPVELEASFLAGCWSSASARVSGVRPFYADYAEAYDLLVTDPVEPWAEAVHDRLVSSGWLSAVVLDAGCGTGRHAAALAAKGHHVDLADASEQLLAQAASRNPAALAMRVDLCALTVSGRYQAVTCRGVLNDMTTDAERDAALRGLRGALSDGGLLLLDVRESEGSRRRADGVSRHKTVGLGARGALEFTSTVTSEAGFLHVVEDYTLRRPGSPADHRRFEFVMRPWSTQEMRERLTATGFSRIEVGPGVGRTTGDRLFVSARL